MKIRVHLDVGGSRGFLKKTERLAASSWYQLRQIRHREQSTDQHFPLYNEQRILFT